MQNSTVPPPMDRQTARASRLRRLEERLNRLRYPDAARTGAMFGVAVAIAPWIASWVPGLQPVERAGFQQLLIGCALGGAITALLAVAGVAVLRAWTRWRAVNLRRRAI
jgi:hypothetical protein